MAFLRTRINEGAEAQPELLWDTVWDPWRGGGDWAIAGADEVQNRGGLQAKQAIATAVILALFTDKRIPRNHPLRKYLAIDADPRGWWGDGVDVRADLHEGELGSLLWVFARAVLIEETGRWVEATAIEALAPLIAQGAAARIEAQADVKSAINRCDLAIQIYAKDGQKIYDFKFEQLWQQTKHPPKPKPFPDFPPR